MNIFLWLNSKNDRCIEDIRKRQLVKRNQDISPHPTNLIDICCFQTKKGTLPKRRTVIIVPPGKMPKFDLVH